MKLVLKLCNKLKKKKYQPVVLCNDLTKHMLETRTIIVPKYDGKKPYEPKISMFH